MLQQMPPIKRMRQYRTALYELLQAAAEKEGIDIPLGTLGNSAAVMEINSAYYDMVRPGVILYGLYPSDEVDRSQLALRPAMSIKANIIHLKKVPAGNSIGYGRKFTTQKEPAVATIGRLCRWSSSTLFCKGSKVIVSRFMPRSPVRSVWICA